jgi:SM-20-related protein
MLCLAASWKTEGGPDIAPAGQKDGRRIKDLAEMTISAQSQDPALCDPRCPHVLYRNVLGARSVAALLDYVALRQGDFRPAPMRMRGGGRDAVDLDRRDCLLLRDVGPLRAQIETFVRTITPHALAQLGLIEPEVEPREFEISAHGDGGHFSSHVDTTDIPDRVRILSCVYYFAKTPRRFQGGELRLFGFPNLRGVPLAAPTADVVPETDSLVVFPSWLTHEVRPVRVPSQVWADGRFAINCWIHRVSKAASAATDAAGV